MSYLVLARKYRPLVFSDVVGQNHVTRTLTNALKAGRVAHAYLFSGARGVGKTSVARILAMAVNCQAEIEDRPCAKCDFCVEISSGQALDVFEIDGASNRGIEEIRELRETVKYLPSKGAFKVYIIDEVHMLTQYAFNALLKTLEEPPAHVIFIFATTEPHRVPATILSRCQRYDFKRIALEDIVGNLQDLAQKEDILISPSSLRLIARESEGSLRDAQSLFDQVIAFSGTKVSDESVTEALGLIDRTLISDTARALLAGDAGKALDLLDKIYSYGYDTKEFTAQLLNYFRSLVVAKVAPDPERILDLLDVELEEIKSTSAGSSLETLNFFFNALLASVDNFRRSAHPRLALETLIVRLAQAEPVQPIAELTARLEGLLGSLEPGIEDPSGSSSGPPSSASQNTPGAAFSPAGNDLNSEAAPVSEQAPSPLKRALEVKAGGWGGFLASIKEDNNHLISSILEKVRVIKFTLEEVQLEFLDEGPFKLIDKEKLNKLLHNYLGVIPRLKLELKQETDDRFLTEEPAGAAESQDSLEEKALDHPLVKSALKFLGGEVVDIIPETKQKGGRHG